MSALEGSTRYRVGWRLERRSEAYERRRERRSSPPHNVMGLPVAACPASDGGGGYDVDAALDEDEDFGGRVKEFDSSSWK
jgi:hypothetical protein